MKKEIIAVALGLIFCALTANAESIAAPLNREDIIALSKPAIVKIYHQVGGKLSIPTIKLDVNTMSLSVDENFKASSKTTYLAYPDYVISYKFDYTVEPQTVYGTGFIVNPDGYIITNAHIASDKYMEQSYLREIEANLVDDMIAAYDKKYPKKLDQMYATDAEWTGIYDKLDADMLKLIMDNAKFDSKLVVIPQSSTDTTLEDILRDGFEAKVVSMMDDLFSEKNQDKDLAVIKIEQKNLPALKIDNAKPAQIGQKVFVWGFPFRAEFNEKDVINPTFTEGIINALKESSDKSFKLIQTDAKISEGSSGSPILNEKDEVVGIITYVSDDTSSFGDSFGWGLPSEIILQIMKNGSVENNTSYYDDFFAGITLMKAKRCKSAIEKFNKTKTINEKFPVNQYVQPYIDNCASIINSGQSIDSIWAEIWVAIKEFIYRAWALIIIIIAGITGLVFEILTLRRQNKEEEADITKIETVVDSQGKEIESLKNRSKNNLPGASS